MSAGKRIAPRAATIPANSERLGSNASRMPDARLLRIETWRRENAAAIKAHNQRVDAGEFDEFLRRF